MRVFMLGLGLGLLHVGCGRGLASQSSSAPTPQVRAGVPPPSDEAGFRKLLVADVVNGGLSFADSDCQAQFGQASVIKPDAFDAFARCVAALHLRPTGRGDSIDDTSVLTDGVFELEAHIVAGRLDFIGFSGRATGGPDRPSITPDALESLRVGGDRNATISADDAKQVVLAANPPRTHTEHLRLCLAETGELSSVSPATTTTVASAAAFSAIARSWRFRPFVVAGKPTAVCAIIGFQYPAAARDADRGRLPRPPQLSKAGHPIYNVAPRDLETLRVVGSKLVVPDDDDKIHLNGQRLVGSFKLCLDETGHYERGTLLQSTGLARYDAKIARTLMEWVYRPYVVDGVAIPVCSAFTFIYSQP